MTNRCAQRVRAVARRQQIAAGRCPCRSLTVCCIPGTLRTVLSNVAHSQRAQRRFCRDYRGNCRSADGGRSHRYDGALPAGAARRVRTRRARGSHRAGRPGRRSAGASHWGAGRVADPRRAVRFPPRPLHRCGHRPRAGRSQPGRPAPRWCAFRSLGRGGFRRGLLCQSGPSLLSLAPKTLPPQA